MIIKFINSFIFGLMLILPLDFLIFIGLKLHYFDKYGVKEYFNIYFIDNQPFLLMSIVSIIFGYLVLYTFLRKPLELLYIVCLAGCIAMLYKPVATTFGEDFFMEKNRTFKFGSLTFQGNIIYRGREFIHIKRKNIKPLVKLHKSKIVVIDDSNF